MTKIEKKIEFDQIDINLLEKEDAELVQLSIKAQDNAYTPHSNFNVGATLRLDDGITISGNNQENMAFPSGLCAERVALFYFGANFKDRTIKSIAVSASNGGKYDDFIMPCGACLQVMAEYQTKQKEKIKIILYSNTGQVLVANGVENFLPMQFKEFKK